MLSPGPGGLAGSEQDDLRFLADLRLDQVIDAVSGRLNEGELVARLLRQRVTDRDVLAFRHEIFRDLEHGPLRDALGSFGRELDLVRGHLRQLAKMRSAQQRQGWFLDAAVIYCRAVRSLAATLDGEPVTARGLLAFRDFLAGYLAGDEFAALSADTQARLGDLAQVRYLIRIKGPRVEVSKYQGEPDCSRQIEHVFERFRQGAVADYRVAFRGWPGMTHVGAQIAGLVAQLFSGEFSALAGFCQCHVAFFDPAVDRFDREIRCYLAYLDYIEPLRAAGLRFCLPEVTGDSREVLARDTFDLALAARLVADRKPVVVNDFELHGPERIIVVSGPNQGGKTTFARTFGQLHHLAATGCPVPGSTARIYLCDQIFTHFERQEHIADLVGKLEDDLLRIQAALRAATPRSVIIMNEIFTSTTLADATFLGREALAKISGLGVLCVYVTFIDELASFSPAVVSMASTIVPADPARRTYKVIRKPADGLAYALALAEKHAVTYEALRERLSR